MDYQNGKKGTMQVGRGLLGLPEFVVVAHGSTAVDPLPELPAEEAAYVHERAIESRRRDFAVGRAAAHQALGLLGADRGPILRGDLGEPLWPPGVVGSITHAAGHIAVAVAQEAECGGIGLDLEHLDRYFPELIAHIAFDEERSRLLDLDETDRPRAAIELFSAKEALYKAFYPRVGDFFGFSSARIHPAPTGGYQGTFTEILDQEYVPGRTFAINTTWSDDSVLATVVLPPPG